MTAKSLRGAVIPVIVIQYVVIELSGLTHNISAVETFHETSLRKIRLFGTILPKSHNENSSVQGN